MGKHTFKDEYDDDGSLVSITEYDEQGNEVYYEDDEGYWNKREYDDKGNEVYFEDSDGFWYKQEYDSQDHVVYYETRDGYWSKREYDSQGNLVYYEDSGGRVIDKRPKETHTESIKGEREMIKLSIEDAIYVTSWAAYSEGMSLSRGGWFRLIDLANLPEEEIFNEFRKVGLEPRGRDEELVVHDYDDYTGIGYYELYGEAYPLTIVSLYEKLLELDEAELIAFIGVKENRGASEALEYLEDGYLNNYNYYTEQGFDEFLEEMLEELVQYDPDKARQYIDEDQIRREYEMDISYDEDTGEPEYEIDDYMLEEIIQSMPKERLSYYLDVEEYKREVLMDGYYEEVEIDGETYYIYEM
jgi:YD repeat-containing protein